ncbi:MAG: MAPEG family protein [Deltaproteobacteria bacterium]|nr:MAPEG family protein [Deltaproteobacteria bacterium]
MTTPLACLAIVALLPYLCAWTGGYFRMRQFGRIDNKHPRQQAAQLTGAGARIMAAQANAWEALAVFTAAMVIAQLGGQDPARAARLAQVFVATRLLHPVLYALDLDVLRSLVFIVGLGCLVGLVWI